MSSFYGPAWDKNLLRNQLGGTATARHRDESGTRKPKNPTRGFFTTPNPTRTQESETWTQPEPDNPATWQPGNPATPPNFSFRIYIFYKWFLKILAIFQFWKKSMHRNTIKRLGRVNFWKNSDDKMPETQPELEEIFQNPTRPKPEKNFKTQTRPITTARRREKIN